MKPAWDRLMKDFKDSKTALVADVDCTTEGKPLCDSNGVKGFPTIKYGDPNNLEAYEGGRDYDSLKQIADAETTFETELKKLQNTYQDLQKAKEDSIAEAKGSGLGMMKSVRAHLESGGGAAEDKDE